MEASNLFLIAALLVAVACGNSQPPTQDRSTKVRQRIADSFLLSFALRFASSFLQSLTASYSSDTVHRLAILGMLWHVLTCDYSYANGCVKTGLINGSRPIFGGGTFSLNAALFSTTLLVSRIYDNQTVFLFISLSVVVFAFYSTTRHEMAKTHPAHSSVAPWLITVFIIMATLCLILDDLSLATTFLLCSLILGGVCPFWKHSLQHFQVLIKGPWDVAQIVPLV
ncbi:hypothetical protein FisN_21Hh008 [Fistulifera solaris]|uniref:Phosphatidylinositol glycan, class C n=1 Tax=Fistulifera solaris TaxID=1519565 RepID=A0A1Z5KAT0_FISSO|nr:hypothetical protein FisN_21Hh008 [Fistulifera solaris]|eukprot:GAX23306.1 hypothetical protein FisN_21Hh008 [Fistulifera solaris]